MEVIARNDKKAIRRRKVKIILLSISFILIALVGFGFWYWSTNKNVIIEKELAKAITKNNEGFYKINYDDMKVDEGTGSPSVTNMKVSYDSLEYVRKKLPIAISG